MSVIGSLVLLLLCYPTWSDALCVLTTSPCDNTWGSRNNQTFESVVVSSNRTQIYGSTGTVQLQTNWEQNWGCIGVVSGPDLQIGQSLCHEPDSDIWTYGPASIGTFVYHNHTTTGLCLTNTGAGHVTLQACGSSNFPDSQLWINPRSTTDPYTRIISKSNYYTDPSKWVCLTRVNPDGQDLPCP